MRTLAKNSKTEAIRPKALTHPRDFYFQGGALGGSSTPRVGRPCMHLNCIWMLRGVRWPKRHVPLLVHPSATDAINHTVVRVLHHSHIKALRSTWSIVSSLYAFSYHFPSLYLASHPLRCLRPFISMQGAEGVDVLGSQAMSFCPNLHVRTCCYQPTSV